MVQPRAERLMNLHILLLGAKRFIGKDAIREACYPEHARGPAGDEAFERAFERDKDALRQIGAVIEVGSADAFFDDEIGYRIPTEQTSLPEIRFESDEAAVLGLAAQVWQQATLAKATGRALAKLKGQGVEIDPSRLEVVAPAITADEPAFEPLWDAIGKRRQVSFPYQRADETAPTTRRVQPWGLARSSGRWYVVGFDVDRGAERVFRLSRIVGTVRASGKSGAYDVPPGTDVREVARRLSPSYPSVRAEVRVRQGTGVGLRRRAESLTPIADRPGWDAVVVQGPVHELADEVLTYGADVVVVAPQSLRDDVVARLRAVASSRSVMTPPTLPPLRSTEDPDTQTGDTAPDQVARLLALVPYLLARGEVRLEDAAAHFGTDADQIERDLRLLFMTGVSPGLPGDLIEVDLEALEGDRIIRVDNADYLARPVRFSPAEATSLVVALRTMVDTAPAEAREVIERTLAKLEQAAGQDGEGLLRLHVTPTPLESSAVVPVLESALAHGHQAEITYHVPSRDRESRRVVDPRGLARVEDLLYLDAWCHTAGGDRAFRVDRIVAATELDSPVADPGARARDLTGGWFTDAETTTVTLRLAPPARWVVEYYPVTGRRPGPRRHDRRRPRGGQRGVGEVPAPAPGAPRRAARTGRVRGRFHDRGPGGTPHVRGRRRRLRLTPST